MGKRFNDARPRDVTVYSGREWTGPGRSYWYESFWKPGDYAQMHHVYEKTISVLVWFADFIAEAESFKDRLFILREARRLEILGQGSY